MTCSPYGRDGPEGGADGDDHASRTRRQERQRDPERTRQEILDVALAEFARNGYSGARVDEIAARTRTTKRMIYYYFTSKEQLYIAVLERAYSTARDAERQLDVDHLEPVSAIRTLAELTFDHHESHPDFISLVASRTSTTASSSPSPRHSPT